MTTEQFQNLRPGDRVVLTISGTSKTSSAEERIWRTTSGTTIREMTRRYVHLYGMKSRFQTVETKGTLALYDTAKKQEVVKIPMPKGNTIGDEIDAKNRRVMLQTVADDLNELVESN